ncbi:uncharacterized protein LOC143726038 [Siphateles boraxobius]|uniref:uncharacterized protein LOC143726038 n=1 Tax=Siphateles boraxobius TaxID=180520 RepID=UPI00406284D8
MGDLVDDLIEDLESGHFQLEDRSAATNVHETDPVVVADCSQTQLNSESQKTSPTVMRVQNRPTSGEKTERQQLDTKQLYRCSDLKKDDYYAVYYDRAYYIGRVTDHCLWC